MTLRVDSSKSDAFNTLWCSIKEVGSFVKFVSGNWLTISLCITKQPLFFRRLLSTEFHFTLFYTILHRLKLPHTLISEKVIYLHPWGKTMKRKCCWSLVQPHWLSRISRWLIYQLILAHLIGLLYLLLEWQLAWLCPQLVEDKPHFLCRLYTWALPGAFSWLVVERWHFY